MTVRMIAPDGTGRTVYVRGATSESAAVKSAARECPPGSHAAWVLPGDCR